MNFDDFDRQMRAYERSIDQVLPSDVYMVARLDGRGFTRLTKEICSFEAPFDVRFRDMMIETVKHLMDCGFRILYGFTQSDEISLLFHPKETAFGRKVRKYDSILAGEASAALSLQLKLPAVMDCRMIPLPTVETVQDYFLWRQEDARRNALNAHCYWLLRKEGLSASDADRKIKGISCAAKTNLLQSYSLNFSALPLWQSRGIGVFRKIEEKTGFNPIVNEFETAVRNCLYTEYNLPIREAYAGFISDMLTAQTESRRLI